MIDLHSSLRRIVVAMSGGVDSSVAAALLVKQGYQVIGIMLRLWNEPGSAATNRCCTPDSMSLARRVAANLDIPFYALDAQEIFYQTVIQGFVDGYAKSRTPNPCLICNREIRWKFLYDHAIAFGADAIATGHYAQSRLTSKGNIELLRGFDPNKDQSYVLHLLTQDKLQHTYFPLGGYLKSQVREMARSFGLPVAESPDSQDLCFLGGDDYRSFLARHAPELNRPGLIMNTQGHVLGQHQGLAYYTIGQRKGLGIASSTPLYVLELENEKNILLVGTRDELGRQSILVHQVNWISGVRPSEPFRAQVKIRYKSRDEQALIIPTAGNEISILFDNPLRDITPGQAAVIYDGNVCLGGGEISDFLSSC